MSFIRSTGPRLAGLIALLFAFSAANAAGVEDYRLTVGGLEKYERATEAMYQFAQDNPEIAGQLDALDMGSTDADPAETAKRFDQHVPGLRKAMEKSGMKLDEYFVFTMVLAGNALGVAMADHFGGVNDTELTPVQRDNMNFVRQHMARFEQFTARMKEKYGDVMEGGDDDEEYYEDEYSDEEYADEDYSE